MNEEEMKDLLFDGRNITISQAAAIMGKSEEYIRQGLVSGRLPIGAAFKRNGSNKYDYYISPKKFYEFTGYKVDGD